MTLAVIDGGLPENQQIPDSSDMFRKIKELHKALIEIDADELINKVNNFFGKSPDEIDAVQFAGLKEQVNKAAQLTKIFLSYGFSYKFANEQCRKIAELYDAFESNASNIEPQLEKYNELETLMEDTWQSYISADSKHGKFEAIKRSLNGYFFGLFGGIINSCKSAGYKKGADKAKEMYAEISRFAKNSAEFGRLEDRIKTEFDAKTKELDNYASIADFSQVNIEKYEKAKKSIRVSQKYETAKQSYVYKIDLAVRQVIVEEIEQLNSEFESAKNFETVDGLEQRIGDIVVLEQKCSVDADVLEMIGEQTGIEYSQNISDFKNEVGEFKTAAMELFETTKQKMGCIAYEKEKITKLGAELDSAETELLRANSTFGDYIDKIVEIDKQIPETIYKDKLLASEIDAYELASEEFGQKKLNANNRIENELKKRTAELRKTIIETGTDFYTDKAMLMMKKIEAGTIELYYSRYAVTTRLETNELESAKEKLSQIESKYKIIQGNIDQIKLASERINTHVSAGNIEELNKTDLDKKFSFSGAYYQKYLIQYSDAVGSANAAIHNFAQTSPAGVFKLNEHMEMQNPLNKDYEDLPKIVLGTYKPAPFTERPELFEQKMNLMPLAEHDRDFQYLHALKLGLKTWAERGSVNHIFKGSSQERYALSKIMGCIDDYIQRSKQKN
jgi:hypothetical protein